MCYVNWSKVLSVHFYCVSYLSTCSIDGVHCILVATSDGTLYTGNIDPRDGGECRITKEFNLLSRSGEFPHGYAHQSQGEDTAHVSNAERTMCDCYTALTV